MTGALLEPEAFENGTGDRFAFDQVSEDKMFSLL